MTQLSITQAMQLAVDHHTAGRFAQAEAIYRQILAAAPNHPEAMHLLGVLAGQTGQLNSAIDLIRRAIAISPHEPRYLSNMGQLLAEAGRLDEAIVTLLRATKINPKSADAWNNLGNALLKHNHIAEAVDAYRRAVEVNPDLPEAQSNLGNALRLQNQHEQAMEHLHRAIVLRPALAEPHNNLGNCLRDMCRIDEAIAEYRQSLLLHNDRATTHYNLATCLLVKGDFHQGLMEYEWRWLAPELGLSKPKFAQPAWDGSELTGKRILLYAEQGFGDAIHFVRYAPLVAQRGGKVVLHVPQPLERLMQRAAGVERVIRSDDISVEFDVHCSLLSLPRIFGTTSATIPAPVPYITADPQISAKWKQRVMEVDAKLRIGLAWAGRAEHANDRNRSMNLPALAPLAQIPGAKFFSLQKQDMTNQSRNAPAGMELIDWTRELSDFADTVGLIEHLDLVIAVDTASAHLAGAMGKRVDLLLPFSPDWRWLLARDDTPWYPTMRLYRQPAMGVWDMPVREILHELARQTR